MTDFAVINSISNRIYEWGQPDRHPLQRMLLTRIGSIALACIEAAEFSVHTALFLGYQLPGSLVNISLQFLANHYQAAKSVQQQLNMWLPTPSNIPRKFLQTASLAAALASTVFFGVIFSPEINFRLHVKLGLATDNIALRKERLLKDKLEWEAKTEQIKKERAQRFAKFQAERQAERDAERAEDEKINSNLAELFLMKNL